MVTSDGIKFSLRVQMLRSDACHVPNSSAVLNELDPYRKEILCAQIYRIIRKALMA